MEKLIEAVNVSYIYQTKYQKTKALSEVSCSFERGKVYAITGKSGSGKSTFLSLLAGLDVPTEGTLTVEGEDMRKMNRDAYRLNRASVIYQAFHLFPLLTVLENVMFPMELQHVPAKEAKARAREYLAKVGLPETLYKKRPNMISGGCGLRHDGRDAFGGEGADVICFGKCGDVDFTDKFLYTAIDISEDKSKKAGRLV